MLKNFSARACLSLFLVCGARAQGISIIRADNVLESRALEGTVIFDHQSGISGALVEDCTPDWKKPIADTRTDAKGKFSFPNTNAKRIHYLRISWEGANTLLVKVKISPNARDLVLNLPPSS